MYDYKIGDRVKVVIPNHFNRELIQTGDEATIEMIDDVCYALFFPKQKTYQTLFKTLGHCIALVQPKKETIQLSDIKIKTEPKLVLKKIVNAQNEFKIGDKVKIPKTKTAFSYDENPMTHSEVVKKALALNQDYLYIVRIDTNRSMRNGIVYILSENKDSNTGDYYSYQDLVSYAKSTTTTKIDSLRDKIFQPLKPKKPTWEVIEDNSIYKVSVLKNNPYTICLLTTKFDKKTYKGIAKCLPDDVYNEEKGIEIARIKAQLKSIKHQIKIGERLLKNLAK